MVVVGFECSSPFTRWLTSFVLETVGLMFRMPTFWLVCASFMLLGSLYDASMGFAPFSNAYYSALRWLVTIAATYYALDSATRGARRRLLVFVSLAVVFNPFIQFDFPRETWLWFDFIVLLLFGITVYRISTNYLSGYRKTWASERHNPEKGQESKE